MEVHSFKGTTETTDVHWHLAQCVFFNLWLKHEENMHDQVGTGSRMTSRFCFMRHGIGTGHFDRQVAKIISRLCTKWP